MAIGGATLVDGVDLRVDGRRDGRDRRAERRRQVDAAAAAVRRPARRPAAAVALEAARHRTPIRRASSRCIAPCCRSMSTSAFPFTVEEIVHMGAGDSGRAAAQPLVDAALHEVGLDAFRHRQLPTLSGGEQQRAHFARVLVQLACGEAAARPRPAAAGRADLEPRSCATRSTWWKPRGAARSNGTAVIAILHDLNLAMRFADRIVLLHRGRLAVDGGRAEAITAETIRRIFEVDVTIDTPSRACRSCCRRPCGPPAGRRHNAATLIPRRYRFVTEPSATCNSRSARHCAYSS